MYVLIFKFFIIYNLLYCEQVKSHSGGILFNKSLSLNVHEIITLAIRVLQDFHTLSIVLTLKHFSANTLNIFLNSGSRQRQ